MSTVKSVREGAPARSDPYGPKPTILQLPEFWLFAVCALGGVVGLVAALEWLVK